MSSHLLPNCQCFLIALITIMMHQGVLFAQSFESYAGNNLTPASSLTSDEVTHESPSKENLGQRVNSRFEDLNPIISTDGKTLYFARKRSPENRGGTRDPQDIWVTTVGADGQWTKSRNLGSDVNSIYADNLCGVTADNNTLVFYVDHQNGQGTFMYRSRTRHGWSVAHPLGVNIVNESHYLESSLSADGNALLFTAKTKKNLRYRKNTDERDIYVVVKAENGMWGNPLNLGPKLNTPGDEFSPFLAADGRTLYFATNGRKGYGNVDIYVSRRKGDGWCDWTEPRNLGPQINTRDFDAYYSVPASGNYAYMVSSYNTTGKADIIRVPLSPSTKPAPVAVLKGIVRDLDNHKPLEATITIEDRRDVVTRNASCNPTSGEYLVTLDAGSYKLCATSPGYASACVDLTIEGILKYTEFEYDLALTPLRKGLTIPLENLLFDEGKADLRPHSLRELNNLVSMLNTNKNLQIELRGHTDNRGTEEKLFELSMHRVEAVRDYLVKHGIKPGRVRLRGFGASRPLAKNNTEVNRQLNRRVEFLIVKI